MKGDSNTEDAFSALSRGLRDISQRKSIKQSAETDNQEDYPQSKHKSLPQQLDFFNNSNQPDPSRLQKKSKTEKDVDGKKTKRKAKSDSNDRKKKRKSHSKDRKEELGTNETISFEEAQSIRKAMGIRSEKGSRLENPMMSFQELETRFDAPKSLTKSILQNLKFHEPTPIQMQAIPAMMENHDLLAIAPTGSGKTLAFLLPIVMQLSKIVSLGNDKHKRSPFALILSPTRELAEQTGRVLNRILENQNKQRRVIKCKILTSKASLSGLGDSVYDIVIATPLRLIGALNKESKPMALNRLVHLVFDEADKLFDDDFVSQVDTILAASAHTQRHLFSATLPEKVETIARSVLRDPVKITVAKGSYGGNAAVDSLALTIYQHFKFVGGQNEQGKVMAVRQMLSEGIDPPVLVFVQSREKASSLFRELVFHGIGIDFIHSEKTHAQREAIISRFRCGKLLFLITTDLLARGIDFKSVGTVINYDIPESANAYVHRIGRTGRAGKHGTAITLFTIADKKKLKPIINLARSSGANIPEWM